MAVWRWLSVLGGSFVCAAGIAQPAYSQIPFSGFGLIESPLEDDSVLERSRPEYDPQGLPLGGFRAYPTFTLATSYDDNVLRTADDHESDFIFQAAPGLSIRSQWTRHYLALRATANRYKYARLSSENRTEGTVTAGGRLDILTGFNVTGAASYGSTFEPRTSRDQAGAARATPYSETEARAAVSWNPFRFGMQVGMLFQRYDFGNTELVDSFGGGQRDNDDRDRNLYAMYTTALYEFSPGYGVFVRPAFEKRIYDLDTGRAEGRDSKGYKVDAGISLLVTQLITGEAYIGYLSHDFEGVEYQDLTGIDYGAQLRWFPSQLVTVHLTAARTPTATTLTGASVADDRRVEVGADYEFRRNLILQAALGYVNTQFEGITRQDEDFSARFGVHYLVNPYMTANFRVARSTRSSNQSGQTFIDNILFIGLTGHL